MQNMKRAIYSKYLLNNEHLKATDKRMAVLTLFQEIRHPLCADDIRKILPEISASTLYRILKTLEIKNLLKKSDPPDDYLIPLQKRDRIFYILK